MTINVSSLCQFTGLLQMLYYVGKRAPSPKKKIYCEFIHGTLPGSLSMSSMAVGPHNFSNTDPTSYMSYHFYPLVARNMVSSQLNLLIYMKSTCGCQHYQLTTIHRRHPILFSNWESMTKFPFGIVSLRFCGSKD